MNPTLVAVLAGLGGLAAGYGIAYLVAQSRGAAGAVDPISARYYAPGVGTLLPGQVSPVVNPLLTGVLPGTSAVLSTMPQPFPFPGGTVPGMVT